MAIKWTRESYIPKGATKISAKGFDAVVYIYYRHSTAENTLILYATGFAGKAQKPTFNYRFKSAESRAKYVARWFGQIGEQMKRRAAYKAERKAEDAKPHGVQVGDIFRASWGYEQTNVEYFQVVALRGTRQVMVREIGKHYEENGFMSGRCAPAASDFLTDSCALGKGNEAKVCVVRGDAIKIDSVRTASRLTPTMVGSLKVYPTAYESHYA